MLSAHVGQRNNLIHVIGTDQKSMIVTLWIQNMAYCFSFFIGYFTKMMVMTIQPTFLISLSLMGVTKVGLLLPLPLLLSGASWLPSSSAVAAVAVVESMPSGRASARTLLLQMRAKEREVDLGAEKMAWSFGILKPEGAAAAYKGYISISQAERRGSAKEGERAIEKDGRPACAHCPILVSPHNWKEGGKDYPLSSFYFIINMMNTFINRIMTRGTGINHQTKLLTNILTFLNYIPLIITISLSTRQPLSLIKYSSYIFNLNQISMM